MNFFLSIETFHLLIIAIILIITWKCFFQNKNASIINKLPGPLSLPIIGSILVILEPSHKVMANSVKRRQKYGPIYRLWLGPYPMVSLSAPEKVEVVLKSSKHTQKSFGYKFIESWLGEGLLTSYGKKWAAHRKLITPTFHFSILQSFIDTYQVNANILIKKLENYSDLQKEFNIFPLVTLCALDIICETAMGTKVNAQLNSTENNYVNSVYRLSKLSIHRGNRFWYHSDFIFNLTKLGKEYQKHLKIVKDFARNVIKARKESLESETIENKKLSFLDLLLKASTNEASIPLTDEELREEVDTFMFEGHDTTAVSISWTLFLLGHHHKIQEDVYEEVKGILHEKMGTLPVMNDLADMKLLERVIKESLRLFPSVPTIGRVLSEDTRFGEYLVPKGTGVFINIVNLHKDPNYYPNPQIFDPDRFLPENVSTRHPYAFLPFSAGPRNCIGQKFAILEEKVILSNLILNYKFESVDKLNEVVGLPEMILRPNSGLKMKIYKR